MFRTLVAAVAAQGVVGTGPTVKTPYGTVVGFTQDNVDAFRGIPYAAPPTGDNRFRPPQDPDPWATTLDATKWPASCLQRGSKGTQTYGPGKAWNTINITVSSEDCLYLNVYAPSSTSSNDDSDDDNSTGALPVMVYYHAGEFRYGSSNDEENAWPYFANGRVILVTANVRIGYFGYAAMDELRSRDPSNSTGNYGTQDQRAVLEWVQKSINAFGGDPTRVTIFGESSGGSQVAFHLSSKKSAGLFSGAILESPGLTQSKTWAAATANTYMAASALTASGSAGCSWPSSSASPEAEAESYLELPGVGVSGLGYLSISKDLTEAQTKCSANPKCWVVAKRMGSYTLYGLSGSILSKAVTFRNYTFSLGPSAKTSYQAFIRMPSSKAAAECLVKADAGELVALNSNPPFGDTFYTDASAPTEDGVELTQSLLHQAVQHPNPDVSVLGGANLDEGTEFMAEAVPISCNAKESDLDHWCSLMFPAELAKQVPAAYDTLQQPVPRCLVSDDHGNDQEQEQQQQHEEEGSDDPVNGDYWGRAMRAAGESAILCPTRAVLNAALAAGQKNVFWYHFIATPLTSANFNNIAYYGSFHGAEVPFVFGDQFEIASDGERHLSAAMGCYWTNFAETGNPNKGTSGDCSKLSLTEWPVIGADGDALIFSNTTITAQKSLRKARCDMFDKYM